MQCYELTQYELDQAAMPLKGKATICVFHIQDKCIHYNRQGAGVGIFVSSSHQVGWWVLCLKGEKKADLFSWSF